MSQGGEEEKKKKEEEEKKKKEEEEKKKKEEEEEKKKKEEEEKKKKEEAEKKKKEEEAEKNKGKVIMGARMHCESCRLKAYKAVIGYRGVEDINIDMKSQKITLKAPSVDAKKLFEFAKKNSGGKITSLIFPDPKDLEKKKEEQKKDEPKKEEKKPVDVTVELKVPMHCAACTKKVEKAAWRIGAVYSVEVKGDKLIIKGKDLDPKKVCAEVIKKSGKHAEVIPPPPPKKEDEKKEGDKKDGDKKEGDNKDGDKKDGDKKDGEKKGDAKKDDNKVTEKKDGEKKEEKQPPKVVVEYYYPPHYVYAPQYFSDENPNACSVM